MSTSIQIISRPTNNLHNCIETKHVVIAVALAIIATAATLAILNLANTLKWGMPTTISFGSVGIIGLVRLVSYAIFCQQSTTFLTPNATSVQDPQTPHFHLFPKLHNDAIMHILSFLPSAKDICRAGNTSRRMQHLSNQKIAWQGAAKTLFTLIFRRLYTPPINLHELILNAGKTAWDPSFLGPETWRFTGQEISNIPPMPSKEMVAQAKRQLLQRFPGVQPILFLVPANPCKSKVWLRRRLRDMRENENCRCHLRLDWMTNTTRNIPCWYVGALLPGCEDDSSSVQTNLIQSIGLGWEAASVPTIIAMEAGHFIKTGHLCYLPEFLWARCPEATKKSEHLIEWPPRECVIIGNEPPTPSMYHVVAVWKFSTMRSDSLPQGELSGELCL